MKAFSSDAFTLPLPAVLTMGGGYARPIEDSVEIPLGTLRLAVAWHQRGVSVPAAPSSLLGLP